MFAGAAPNAEANGQGAALDVVPQFDIDDAEKALEQGAELYLSDLSELSELSDWDESDGFFDSTLTL